MPNPRDPNDPAFSRGGYKFVNGEWVRENNLPGAADAADNPYVDAFGNNNSSVARDLDRAGKAIEYGQGELDPNRTMEMGNQAGYGYGSKFMGDLGSAISGGYNAAPVHANMGAGQLGATQYAGGPQGDQSRAMQMSLMQQLQDQAAGKGPSLAQMQLQKGGDAAMSQAMALGASQRGAGQAGMLKGIAGQQANIGQGMASDAAMLRLQEQMQARQMLGTGLGQMRGADDQMSQFNAGQGNQMTANRGQLGMDAERLRVETELAMNKLRAQAAQQNSIGGMVGSGLGAVTSIWGGGSKGS